MRLQSSTITDIESLLTSLKTAHGGAKDQILDQLRIKISRLTQIQFRELAKSHEELKQLQEDFARKSVKHVQDDLTSIWPFMLNVMSGGSMIIGGVCLGADLMGPNPMLKTAGGALVQSPHAIKPFADIAQSRADANKAGHEFMLNEDQSNGQETTQAKRSMDEQMRQMAQKLAQEESTRYQAIYGLLSTQQ